MRYFKFSILTGIGLFALAMFFLSQSIQDFLNPETNPAQSNNEPEALDYSLDEPEKLSDLKLDFPAGANPSKAILSQTVEQPALTTVNLKENADQDQNTARIKLLSLPKQQTTDQKSLNILLLTQTTKQQRTTLIEELIRLDADLVRQIAFKPIVQLEIPDYKSKSIQQTSLSNAPANQSVSAGYSVSKSVQQSLPSQNTFLVHKETLIHLVATLRGVKIKTIGVAEQNGSLNQLIQVVPSINNMPMNATVQSRNLATLNITSKLQTPESTIKPPEIKLSELGEFQPAEIIKLSGAGLVVGLNGTGDSAYSSEAIQALKSSIKTMNINLNQIKSPIKVGNLANVSIIAYIPNSGVTKGQRLKCYITAANEEVNLTGGYLLPTGLLDAASSKTNADAIVMGQILTDQNQNKSRGVISEGAQLLANVKPNLISDQGLPHLRFFLNNSAGQPLAGPVITQQINQFLQTQNSQNTKALLRSSSMIMISLPASDQQQAQKLVAQLLSLQIPSQLFAMTNQNPELIIDTAKGQIQTRGTILLKPVKMEYNQFTLEIAPPSALTTPKLKDLLSLMQFMHIPETNQILILRALQQQGKIAATYREL